MTKYILAGGADRKYESYARNLNKEVFKAVRRPVEVLSCFFSEPRERWRAKFSDRQTWFKQAFGTDVHVILADPAKFSEQVKAADVIYFHGGKTELLEKEMHAFPDITTLFEGKVVIGSSAGAIWFSKKAWTCDFRKVINGGGITDCNTVVHYDSDEYGVDDPRGPIDWEKAKAELQAAIGSTEKVTLLREGEFVVIEQ